MEHPSLVFSVGPEGLVELAVYVVGNRQTLCDCPLGFGSQWDFRCGLLKPEQPPAPESPPLSLAAFSGAWRAAICPVLTVCLPRGGGRSWEDIGCSVHPTNRSAGTWQVIP